VVALHIGSTETPVELSAQDKLHHNEIAEHLTYKIEARMRVFGLQKGVPE
jgi:hypothetical protein